MNLLEKICEELRVEPGEEWTDNVGDTYKITSEGLFYKYTAIDWDECNSIDYRKLLTGELKPKWRPKYGEEYQTPQLGSHLKFSSKIWYDHESDDILMRRGLVFKTSDEAIAAADKMLEALKEGLTNEFS